MIAPIKSHIFIWCVPAKNSEGSLCVKDKKLTSDKPKNRAGDDKKKPRKKRKLTEERLRNGAYFYLGRFAASRARLTLVLENRVRRAAFEGRCELEEAEGWVAPIVQKCADLGLIDDTAYAAMRARSLMQKGKAPRYIAQDLRAKGLSDGDIESALDSLKEEAGEDPSLHAAKALMRRRRMGAYRDPAKREDYKDKDLGAMARAGLSLNLARALLALETVEEVEDYLL